MDDNKILAVTDVRYVSYLRKLKLETWFVQFSDERYIEIYNEVKAMGITIDGDSVTLEVKGNVLKPRFDYHAYKNLVLARYPETKFDFQLVYDGDDFSFRKDSGKVSYQHVIGNPFSKDKKIIGAYGIIKNSVGEFIEVLTVDDIAKMRNVAKTKNIWDTWYDRMVLKSIIKRICTTNFKDVIRQIDEVDSENYELDNVNVDATLQEEIAECSTLAQITAIYNREKGVCKDKNRLIALCANRKKEIEVTPQSPKWADAIFQLQNGKLIGDLRKEMYMTDATAELLTAAAI